MTAVELTRACICKKNWDNPKTQHGVRKKPHFQSSRLQERVDSKGLNETGRYQPDGLALPIWNSVQMHRASGEY
eukprot:6410756-Amphidinium_carterae.1